MNNIAIIIGGYVNGYSMIQELHENKVHDIGLLYYGNEPAKFSNKLIYKQRISREPVDLLKSLLFLRPRYDKIVLFPCDESQIELLLSFYQDLKEFCFFPFNRENIIQSLDKEYQYITCKKNDIPYPKTVIIDRLFERELLKGMMFPMIIKPRKRYDSKKIFRIQKIDSIKNFELFYDNILCDLVNENYQFILSELVPGDTNNGIIYAYTCYRSPRDKQILNEWVGRKESQYPDDYGVFATASSCINRTVLEQGRKIVHALDAYGIVEPEFKFDERDGKYKLMEVNFRSMMWHRMGNLCGVKLQYTQWLDAVGRRAINFKQDIECNRTFSYHIHEVYNLISKKSYYGVFIRNVLSRRAHFALWDARDPIPFMIDLLKLIRLVPKAIIKRVTNA